jgi:LacI family xylobiose transport system transcriptional regulator
MAEAAARLVLELGRSASQETPTATRVELATSLVVRTSTGAPPTR